MIAIDDMKEIEAVTICVMEVDLDSSILSGKMKLVTLFP
jgi:hypothetical protein